MKKNLSPAAMAAAIIVAVLLLGGLSWYFAGRAYTAPVVESKPPDWIDPVTRRPKVPVSGSGPSGQSPAATGGSSSGPPPGVMPGR